MHPRLLCFFGIVYLLCGNSLPVYGAQVHSEHTFKLSENEKRPAASLEDAAWLVGSWEGTAFGKRFEEVWNAASAHSMVGMFKLYDSAGVEFYELMLLTVDEGTLSLKVKHFNADFTAWEDKADFVNFRLVKLEKNALHFGGISFYRRSENLIDAYILLRDGDELSEHHLLYERVPGRP